MPRIMSLLLVTLFCVALIAAAAPQQNNNQNSNTLTKQESAEGWKLLFDGASLKGWRGFHQPAPPAVWAVADGTITRRSGDFPREQRGDLITVDQFENFEFSWEWKLSRAGNSGVKYLVSEDLPKTGRSGISFEYQILDDDNHPDAKMGIAGNRTSGALYDLLPPGPGKKLRPVGEFNHSRIIKRGAHIEHWLNGVKILEFEQGGALIKERIAASKFKDTAGFGEARRGHILIQDHDDEIWYRNLKIRELK